MLQDAVPLFLDSVHNFKSSALGDVELLGLEVGEGELIGTESGELVGTDEESLFLSNTPVATGSPVMSARYKCNI